MIGSKNNAGLRAGTSRQKFYKKPHDSSTVIPAQTAVAASMQPSGMSAGSFPAVPWNKMRPSGL